MKSARTPAVADPNRIASHAVAHGVMEVVDACVVRFPDMAAQREALLAHVSARGKAPYLADVAFAYACACGVPAAVRELQSWILQLVPTFIRHLRLSGEDADEVVALVAQRLLGGGPDGRCNSPLLQFQGTAELQGWLRVVAVRAALTFMRGERNRAKYTRAACRDAAPHAGLCAGLIETDPVLRGLRASYALHFREAFAAAVERLAPQTRALLRFAVVDGLTLAQIGQLSGAHAATASRWLAEARAQLAAHTAAELGGRLGISTSAARSAIRLLGSEIDASVARVLQHDEKR